jgi:2Fe-2S ferredoxin
VVARAAWLLWQVTPGLPECTNNANTFLVGYEMPRITVLPHPEYVPDGAEIEQNGTATLCDVLLANGVDIEHACGKVGACTTCHVVVTQGFESLDPSDENEEDLLDRAWGLQPHSRLSCQVIVGDKDIVVEIPKYSINHAKENA